MKIFGGGADKQAKRAAEEARQREAQRQARLTQGRSSIDTALSGFDDNFFGSRASAYDQWASPQLDEQFAKQKQKLIYALSRGGLLNSSEAGARTADLNSEYADRKQTIKARGQDYANNARRDVSDARSNLLSMLSSTEDPNTVGDEAVRRAAALREQPSFDPLGALFTDIADQISKVQRAGQIGSAINGGATLYSRSGDGSGRIVG